MINIVKAEKKHLKELNELLYQVHDVHVNGRPDIFKKGVKKFTDEELIKLLEEKNKPIFIAVDKDTDEVLGHLFCIYQYIENNESLENRKVLFIDDLCVHEKARGKSIGKKLCEFSLELAKKEKFDAVTLNIWNFNEDAFRLYEKLGFKPLKTLMEIKL